MYFMNFQYARNMPMHVVFGLSVGECCVCVENNISNSANNNNGQLHIINNKLFCTFPFSTDARVGAPRFRRICLTPTMVRVNHACHIAAASATILNSIYSFGKLANGIECPPLNPPSRQEDANLKLQTQISV